MEYMCVVKRARIQRNDLGFGSFMQYAGSSMVDIIVWLIGILEVRVRDIFGLFLYVTGSKMCK